MLATVCGAGLYGIDGFIVTTECDCQDRLPCFELVGLPDAAVKEAKERVRAACLNGGWEFPDSAITVNLAPADRRKEGSGFDLPIILGILCCTGVLERNPQLAKSCFIGELSLSGKLRPVRGILSMCVAAKDAGFENVFVPYSNGAEAAAVSGINVYAAENVRAIVMHLRGEKLLTPVKSAAFGSGAPCSPQLDFADIKGQYMAKRAMEIAAAGGHNILLIGPPGTGKSMLAKRLPSILPPLTFEEAVETTKIHSVAGILPENVSLVHSRPFRAPHHTMSAVSLVGGGMFPLPGEVSLAHNGVLFLDELPEFPKQVTDSLRQPLEDRKVTITRANGRVTFPCSFMLVGAMNPCRCGYFGHPTHPCTCRPDDVKRYISRVSGPLVDRMDIQIEMPSLTYNEVSSAAAGESSEAVRERVIRARQFAIKRYGGKFFSNSQLGSAEIREFCRTDSSASALLHDAYDSLGLSARGYDRILRVARTIADLSGSETIRSPHVAEAIQMRSLDRKYWGN